jgi:hypothetical protein
VTERLQQELDEATAELKRHMASWEYAYAMAAGPSGEHPVHWATRERTAALRKRVEDLKARLQEHDV